MLSLLIIKSTHDSKNSSICLYTDLNSKNCVEKITDFQAGIHLDDLKIKSLCQQNYSA